MNRLKKCLKLISIFLAFVVLLQGCTVYKSTPITLEQAVQKESKTKVKWNDGFTSKYKKIIIENGNYYGVGKKYGEIQKSLLEEKKISKIKEKNKTLSAILNTSLVVFGVFTVVDLVDNFKDFDIQ